MSNLQHPSAAVTISGAAVPVVEVNAQRVVTLAMIDKVHGRPEGTAGRNFRENRDRLALGQHYHQVSSDEFRRNNPGALPEAFRRPEIIVLTERGYLMLVKSFTDDLAWQVQDQLVEAYFRSSPAAPRVPLTYIEALRAAADSAEEAERAKIALVERDAAIAELAPRSAALARIADADDTLNMTEAAKALQMRPIDLRNDLVARQWIWKRPGGKHWLGRATKVEQKLLIHKVDTVQRRDGSDKIVEQVRFTAKGVTKLAEIYEREAVERVASREVLAQ